MTIADFGLLATIDPVEIIDVDISEYSHIVAWRKKLMNETFYKKTHNSYSETFDAMMNA